MALLIMLRQRLLNVLHKYAFLLITFSGLGLCWLLNIIFWPDNPGFIGLALHPYLFLVIIVAALQGLGPALLCAFVVSLSYIGGIIWRLFSQGEELSRIFQFSYFSPVISFFITGLAVGFIANRQKQIIANLSQELTQARQHIDNLHAELTILQEKNVYLKKHSLGEREFLTMLYQTCRGMASLVLEDFQQALIKTAEEFLEAEKIALFMLQGDKLVFSCGLGYGLREIPEPNFNLLKKSLSEKKVMAQLASNGSSEQSIAIVGPLFLGEQGEPIGVLWLEGIPFLHYTPLSLRLITILTDWASLCLATIFAFEAIQKQSVEKTSSQNFTKVYELLKRKYQGLFPFGAEATIIEKEIKRRLTT